MDFERIAAILARHKNFQGARAFWYRWRSDCLAIDKILTEASTSLDKEKESRD